MITRKFFNSLISEFENVLIVCSVYGFNSIEDLRCVVKRPFGNAFVVGADFIHNHIFYMPIGVLWNFDVKKNSGDKLAVYCARERTNPKERNDCLSIMTKNAWCDFHSNIKFDEYISQLHRAKFTISPEGKNYDCYRTWEALYCGSYPVVKRRAFTEYFSKHLPIVVVDKWEDVTEEFLNAKYEEFQNREWNYEMLTQDYWKRQLSNQPINFD